jgi:hypothetical protein
VYATPSCLRIVSGMFQSPDFVKAIERDRLKWNREKKGKKNRGKGTREEEDVQV